MNAYEWILPRLNGTPETLRSRMLQALETAQGNGTADQLAAAACNCLETALRAPSERRSALDLLAADALFTHACEAAATVNGAQLTRFAGEWNAERFDMLLEGDHR